MKTFHNNYLENIILFLLILGMLVLPTSYMEVKLAAIIILIVSNINHNRYKTPYSKIVMLILLVIYLKGVWAVGGGVIKGTLEGQELYAKIPFTFLYPLLLYLLFPYLRAENAKLHCANTIIIAHALIIGINLYNLIGLMYGLPILRLTDDLENVIYDESSLGFGTNNLHQLIFTTPFVVAMGFSGKIKPVFFVPLLIVTFGFIVLTSRAALLVVALISMTIPYIIKKKFNMLSGIKIGRMSIIVATLLLLLLFRYSHNIYVSSSFDDFAAHFDKNTDIRFNQRELLIKEWKKSPITGVGAGKKFNDYNRGMVTNFESTYHSDLAQNGLIGFGLFCLYIWLIMSNLYKRAREEKNVFYFSCLMGLGCCIVAASTNPVLGTFDRLFSIYICIACLSLPAIRFKEIIKKEARL